ncbi:MAG: hypothetical protein JXR97_15410 [Planctomycetes bacterium]|nr:hypothetical protein [Planctomycetota bacterium]
MTIAGIVFGLMCGLGQAFTYLLSRRFMKIEGHSSGRLLCLSHIIMGLFSLALLPFLWIDPVNGWTPVIWPLIGTTLFYVVGQLSLFQAVKLIEGSRVASMLSFKIALLALLVTVTGTGIISTQQWIAVAVAVAAVQLINVSPRTAESATSWKAYPWIGATCLGYAISDFHIKLLLKALSNESSPAISAFAVALTYTLAAAGSLFIMTKYRDSSASTWRMALPFAVFWYFGMLCLFIAMGYIGIVGAVILQSTRGIWAIILGIIVAHLGHLHLEGRLTLKYRLIQVFAALMMCAAIALFATGKVEEKKTPEAVAVAPASEAR